MSSEFDERDTAPERNSADTGAGGTTGDASMDRWDAMVEAQPKPLKWRMRAQVGDRMRWYELPEEVRSPYQPE